MPPASAAAPDPPPRPGAAHGSSPPIPSAPSFAVDRLGAIDDERIEVRGRWTGVRGLRFVRPELIVHGADGAERRLLAELDEKPWEAHDDEPWRATFPLAPDLDAARALELSVATGIVVTLRGTPPARPTAAATSAERRRPPIPLDDGAPRDEASPADSAARRAEHERLLARVATAEGNLRRERERRAEAERALERRRDEGSELSAEVGRLRAELELARAAEREASSTTDLLDSSRRDRETARTRYDALAAEHARTLRAEERLRSELAERTGERDAARSELERRAAASVAVDPSLAPASLPFEPPAYTVHTARPLNPSLSARRWSGRLLAVLVLAAAIVAVIVILTSTVLH